MSSSARERGASTPRSPRRASPGGSARASCVARSRCEIRSLHRLTQASEHGVGVAGDHDVVTVGSRVRVRPARRRAGSRRWRVRDRRRRARSRRPSTPSAPAPLRRSPRRPLGRVRCGSVRAAAASAPIDGEQRGERIADRDAGARGRPIGLTGRVPDAAHRFADRAEAGFGRRAGRSARSRRRARAPRRGSSAASVVVVQPPTLERPGPEVLDHDVALRRRSGARAPRPRASRRLIATDRLLRAIAGHHKLCSPSTRTP